MGPSFCLMRYATSGPDVWFKAVGEPNTKEYSITIKLAELYPSYLPILIGTHAAWNGWLMLDASSQHLDDTWDLRYWQNAATSLAALQIETIGNAETLMAAGCNDFRLKQLEDLIVPFLDAVAGLMAIQPVSPPRVLTSGDLSFVERKLRTACRSLEMLGFPEALGHTDLNGGNVLVNSERAVFIDWAEGNVGHPFLTFEYLLGLLRRCRPDLESWSNAIRSSYCSTWSAMFSAADLARAFHLTPLVAVLAFAASCPGWQEDIRGLEPNLAKLLRALARRMYLESEKIGDDQSWSS